jgi:hypothetical protein
MVAGREILEQKLKTENKNYNYYGSSSSVQQKAGGGRRYREITMHNMASNLTYIR